MENEIKWIISSVQGEKKYHHCAMPPPPPMRYAADLLKGRGGGPKLRVMTGGRRGSDGREVRSESHGREEGGARTERQRSEREMFTGGIG